MHQIKGSARPVRSCVVILSSGRSVLHISLVLLCAHNQVIAYDVDLLKAFTYDTTTHDVQWFRDNVHLLDRYVRDTRGDGRGYFQVGVVLLCSLYVRH